MNVHVQYLDTCFHFSVPRTGIAGSYGDCMLKHIRKLRLYEIKFIRIAGHMIGVMFKYVKNCFIQSDSII